MSTKVKWEGKPFWNGQAYIYPLNYLLHMGAMLSNMKVFIILFLLCLWEEGTPWQFSKQISKLSFQLSVQVYSLLDQTEGEKKVFFGECKKGDQIIVANFFKFESGRLFASIVIPRGTNMVGSEEESFEFQGL